MLLYRFGLLAAKFRHGVPQHGNRGANVEPGDEGGYKDVGPAGGSRENATCREYHRDISKSIISAAEPNGSHIAVAASVTKKHQRHGNVDHEGK